MTLQNTGPFTYAADVPLHVQVRELIRRQTLNGDLIDDNGRLKTESELVKLFGVSRVTIRNAMAPLVAGGMFDRTPGRGTFLRSNQSEHWMGRLLGFQEVIQDAGYEPGARILDQGMTNAHDGDVRAVLRERAVWQLRRVRYADATPIAIEHAFYPPDIGLELETRDLISIKMYQVLEDELGFKIEGASQLISAKLSTPEEAALLDLPEMGALIEMRRHTMSTDGRCLELLRSVYRPDFYQFSIDLSRRLY